MASHIALHGPEQNEGRGYLGLGVLLLCAVAVALSVSKGKMPLTHRRVWPLLAIVAVMTIYAFGTQFSLGNVVLFDITPPVSASIFTTFRASGRFIWPSVYMITLFSVVITAQRSGKAAGSILLAAFIIQMLDLSPLRARTEHIRQGLIQSEPGLQNPQWHQLASGRRHIMLVPSPACGEAAAPYLPFSLLAGDEKMTINTGYLARFDEARTFAYCDAARNELASGKRDEKTLYIINPKLLEQFKTTSNMPLRCKVIDGYNSCIVDQDH